MTISARIFVMSWLNSFFLRLAGRDWRDIATVPFDRAVELAVIDGKVGVLPFFCLRHGDDWLEAETLRPVTVMATHWRFARGAVLPMGCCC
jgi:hypothetical protein